MTLPADTTTAPLNVFVTYADSLAGRAIVRAWARQGARVVGSTVNGTLGAAVIRGLGAVPAYTDLSREADLGGTLAMMKADVVVDLSSMLVNQLPFSRVEVNPDALDVVPLLNAAHARRVKRLVYVSFLAALPGVDHGHDAAHHGQAHALPTPESTGLRRDNDVFRALARAESVLLRSDFDVVVLRAGYVYGDHTPAFDQLMAAIKGGQPLPRGAGVAPFVHMDDLASAVLLAAQQETLTNRVYHISDDQPMSLDAFAGRLCAALGVGQPLHLPFLNALARGLQAELLRHSVSVDATRAKAELGWSPRYPTVSDGLEQMLLAWRAAEAPALPATTAETGLVKA